MAVARGRLLPSLVTSIVAVFVAMLVAAGSTSAHTQLVATDPADGTILAEPPSIVTLTFNEPVDPVDAGFVLVDASGSSQTVRHSGPGDRITVTLPPDLGEGTVTLGWRVISADGHPVAGGLSFSIGTPSDPADRPEVPTDDVPWTDRLLGIAQAVGYGGLLVAVGSMLFALVVVPGSMAPPPKIWKYSAIAAGIGIAGDALALPLTVARQQGLGLGELRGWATQLDIHQERSFGALTIGLVTVLAFGRDLPRSGLARWLALAGAAIAIVAPTIAGHTNSFDPRWVFRAANTVHVLAASVWLGGLVGLILAFRQRNDASAPSADALARLVVRFGTLASLTVALLLISGIVDAWITLGSLESLWHTTYGRILLGKVALVGFVLIVAAWNHFRLVPAIAETPDDSAGWNQLRRTVTAEASLLALAVLLTGFLVNQSPLAQGAATPAPPLVASFSVPAGDAILTGTIEPARIGDNEIRFAILDAAGNPIEPVEPPEIQISNAILGLGPISTVSAPGDEPGAFQATIRFPSAGLWEVRIPVRISRFSEVTGTVSVDIRSP